MKNLGDLRTTAFDYRQVVSSLCRRCERLLFADGRTGGRRDDLRLWLPFSLKGEK